MSFTDTGERLSFYKFLPPAVRVALDKILLSRASVPSELHIKIGAGSSVIIDGERLDLSVWLEGRDVEGAFGLITENCLYAYRDSLSSGYITLRGGVRVGVVGEARYDSLSFVGLSSISALCFRIPSGESSFKSELCDAFFAARSGLLIYSPPGAGKTSALRSLAKALGGENGKRVVVIDERLEFSPEDYFDTRVDLLRGFKKRDGLGIALRSLSPEVIMVDEIGSEGEAFAMLSYLNSGVKFVATAHADGLSMLKRKKNLEPLFERGVFDVFVGLRRFGASFFCEVDSGDF